jgi:gliding motility-associated-like protein
MKQLTIILFFISALNIKAQVAVSNTAPYNSSAFLVNNVLSGGGVVASNITFNGDPDQIGFFSGIGSNLNLDSGIVISSGKIIDIPNGGAQPSFDFSNPGDPDLLTIAQSVRPGISSSHDAANLEFDFTVVGDTVEFRFVFASEEYLTWVNSNYNDIFAFFLSGPGITGPYASPAGFPSGAVNVAIVPGVTPPTPITISTIHPGLNSQFYIDNPSNATHDFNGFTVVMVAKYAVECGGTYHFKFAIADCEDGTLDTGVFIEAGSLTSSGVGISATTPFPNNTIVEACGDAIIHISRSDTSVNDTINLAISGNAIASEYSTISTSQVFLPGEDTLSFNVSAFVDNITEGIDTIVIEIQGNTGCNMVTIYIEDYTPMSITVSDSINICTELGEVGQIWANVTDGRAPYWYGWSDGVGPGDTLIVAPEETTYYTPEVFDGCGNSVVGEVVPVWVQCQLVPTNVFTPNGDGMNDFFTIFHLDDYPDPSVRVYNRWGNLVYESDSYQNDWDGDDLPVGTYFYVISPNNEKYEYDNNAEGELKYTVKGTVQLFR